MRQTVRKIAAIHPAIRLSGPRRAGLKCGRHGSCLAAPAPGHTGFHGIRSGIYGAPPLRPGFRCTSSGLPFVARMQRSGIREKQFPERFELSSLDCRKPPGSFCPCSSGSAFPVGHFEPIPAQRARAGHSFNPLVAMPWMKRRWNIRNMIRVGRAMSTAPAISRVHSTLNS